ncbi:MAG: hypothetical protein Q605_AUC00149G0002, partial [Actinomyces urogenitalis DORA_12]
MAHGTGARQARVCHVVEPQAAVGTGARHR